MFTANPVHAAATGHINSSFEVTIFLNPENFLHAAHNAIAPEKSTRISVVSFGCNIIVYLSDEESMMRMLTSPVHYLKTQRARRQQVRKALQMLSVSGVVRPGHIERRYYAHPAQVDALNRQIERPVPISATKPSQIPIWRREINIDLARIRQMVGALRPAKLQVGQ